MGRTTVFFVGGDTAKDSIFARMKIEEPGPRFMHFPHGHGHDEALRQLTAEEIRTRMQHGFPIRYYKIRERNEALDCRVYSLAALEVQPPERLAENMAKEPIEIEPEPLSPVHNAQRKPTGSKRLDGGGFVNSWR